MKVKINGVYSPGNIDKERVSMKALEDVNITLYALMDHTFTEEGDLSDKGRHVYKFPSKKILKDELIILYTKNGVNCETKRDNVKIHFFYWGRKNTIWNKNGKETCTLMEVHDTHIVKVNSD